MKKRLKTRNKILCAVAAGMTAFLVYTLAVYTIRGWQWDGLFPYVLGVGGVADVMTAAVAIADKMTDKKSKGDENK